MSCTFTCACAHLSWGPDLFADGCNVTEATELHFDQCSKTSTFKTRNKAQPTRDSKG